MGYDINAARRNDQIQPVNKNHTPQIIDII